MRLVGIAVIGAVACSQAHPLGDAATHGPDTRAADAAIVDGMHASIDGSIGSIDGSTGSIDAAPGTPDAKIVMTPDANIGPITGGPCLSQTPGATAYRIRWADGGGTAYPVYEVDGLPDKSRDHAGAYGYQIGFTPSFVDPFLGDGGLQLDGSDFVDLELSTSGLSSISNATLSIYGRSYAVSTDGSFNWQTFVGYNETPSDFVSNVPPYQWYSADMTTELDAGDSNVLIRIKAGPSSGALVVNRIELCVTGS
ncbi:MAG TPA: hypothetical protein VL463_21055 [Kofleriaceae bacterium]|nr:hypothetical protein [Kofleriaceae bacterium]